MKKIIMCCTILALAACKNTMMYPVQNIQVSEELKKLVAPYQIGQPKNLVRQITLSGSFRIHGDEPTSIHETINIQPTDTANILLQTKGVETNLVFLGEWLSLADADTASKQPFNRTLGAYQQNKMWQNAPVGTQFERKIHGYLGNDAADNHHHCTITQEIPAHILHPDIQGKAKEILCVSNAIGSEEVGYYLADYHFYVVLKLTVAEQDFYLNHRITQFE